MTATRAIRALALPAAAALALSGCSLPFKIVPNDEEPTPAAQEETPSQDVTPEEASKVIFGYTVANDVSARDLQRGDGQWARAKGMDTFCPIGPWIETDLDPQSVSIVTRRDGEVVQDGTSADMVHGVLDLISHCSKAFTLLPGDIILTGTPAGVGPVEAGQRVDVEIDAIGTLSNPFVAAE